MAGEQLAASAPEQNDENRQNASSSSNSSSSSSDSGSSSSGNTSLNFPCICRNYMYGQHNHLLFFLQTQTVIALLQMDLMLASLLEK
jgi:hypothetical protein